MTNQKLWLAAILLLTFAVIVFTQSSKDESPQNLIQKQTTKNELISIAKTALEVELSLQVNDKDSLQNVSDDRFANAMQKRFANAITLYKENITSERKVKDQQLRVYDEKLKLKKSRATLFLTTFSNISYIDSNGESFDSGGETKYQFEFEYQNNIWEMIDVTDVSFDNQSIKLPEKTEAFPKAEFAMAGVAPTVSRNGVVTYAIRHVHSPNPAYREFSNDCTNFVSQALYNNGWGMIWGDRLANSSWYYYGDPYSFYPFSTYQSYTWAVAHNFALFNFSQGRASSYNNPSDSNWGDVLQVDFTGDGHIDHNTIVTKLDNGEVYLTYHTTNYLNRSLSYFKANYPKAVYYGWHLYFNSNEINITKMTPVPVKVGKGTWLTITGTNFRKGLKASVNQWAIADTGVSYKSSNTVLVYVVMNNKGSFTLQLKNPDGTFARKNFLVS
jgi:hypothetical protein